MKIEMQFAISFHFKMFYMDSICDTCWKKNINFKKIKKA